VKRFKFLFKRVEATRGSADLLSRRIETLTEKINSEMEAYTQLVRSGSIDFEEGRSQRFWCKYASVFPLLSPLAMNLLALPASEAYAERVFSVCGDMTRGKRNRKSVTLERSVFLKVNKQLLK